MLELLKAFDLTCLRLGLACLRFNFTIVFFNATPMRIIRVTQHDMPRLVQASLV